MMQISKSKYLLTSPLVLLYLIIKLQDGYCEIALNDDFHNTLSNGCVGNSCNKTNVSSKGVKIEVEQLTSFETDLGNDSRNGNDSLCTENLCEEVINYARIKTELEKYPGLKGFFGVIYGYHDPSKGTKYKVEPGESKTSFGNDSDNTHLIGSRCIENLCEEVENYPYERIKSEIEKHPEYKGFFEEIIGVSDRRLKREVTSKSEICEIEYVTRYPRIGVNINGHVKKIVNIENYTQKISQGICLDEKCKQKYKVVDLIVFKGEDGVESNKFRVPVGCHFWRNDLFKS